MARTKNLEYLSTSPASLVESSEEKENSVSGEGVARMCERMRDRIRQRHRIRLRHQICESMDRISNLPDEIIQHIGSFLSAKEIAFTTVLSKRWRNLFTIITYLHFDCTEEDANFTDFVDRLLALPASYRVRKCFLNCCMWLDDNNIDHAAKNDLINRCLRDLLKRGVLVLKLWANGKEGRYSLPFELFTCKTITKLSLGCNSSYP